MARTLLVILALAACLGADCGTDGSIHVTIGDSYSQDRTATLDFITGCQIEQFTEGGRACSQVLAGLPYIEQLLLDLPPDATVWFSCGASDTILGAPDEVIAGNWDAAVAEILRIQPGWHVVTLRYMYGECRTEFFDLLTMPDDTRVDVFDPWWIGETLADDCHPTPQTIFERTTWALPMSGAPSCWGVEE